MKRIVLSAIFAVSAAAQAPVEPPALIQIVRAPWKDDGTMRVPYQRARAAVNVFGMQSITGWPETWLIESHDSFASIEDLDRALAGVTAPNARADGAAPRTMIALYRPDWSYRPDLAVKAFPKSRYLHVSVHQVRPGAGADFGEVIKQRRAGFDRMNLDRPDMAYQVISGAPTETFVILAPLTTLKTLDDALARFDGSRGGKAADWEISREHMLLRMEPSLSWLSDAITEADPDFWRKR
jgi:hypothetical protein